MEYEVKSKVGLAMIGIVILVAIGFRLRWWVDPPQTTDNPIEDIDYDRIEESIFGYGGLDNIDNQLILIEDDSQIDAIAPQDESDAVLTHTFTHSLLNGRAPSVTSFQDGYVVSVMRDATFYAQRYDANMSPISDIKEVATTVSTVQYKQFQPSVQSIGDQLIALTVTEQNGIFQQHVSLINDQLEVTESFMADEVIGQGQLQSRIGFANDQIIIATPEDNVNIRVIYYSLQGTIQREHLMQEVGSLISMISDETGVILLSENGNEVGNVIQFTKLNQDATQSIFALSSQLDCT